MSHTPPIPTKAVSAYPLDAAQAEDRPTARQDLADQTMSDLKADEKGGQGIRIAVGAAVGSAAIAAALIFYNRAKAKPLSPISRR